MIVAAPVFFALVALLSIAAVAATLREYGALAKASWQNHSSADETLELRWTIHETVVRTLLRPRLVIAAPLPALEVKQLAQAHSPLRAAA